MSRGAYVNLAFTHVKLSRVNKLSCLVLFIDALRLMLILTKTLMSQVFLIECNAIGFLHMKTRPHFLKDALLLGISGVLEKVNGIIGH